ncbi:primosomal protein N' [Elizabethkingia sp. JS20170427COW]|uniref:replication restart helicase PriA n=1 Tax=Elizabethkingia sp. JS20170427COW TaxID=2583851 RepID=UPI0011105EBB|nr:primosomal protein N' [Elizabethkingia sp. JS20170427COW]QCX52314.1 primosomal protein N' [Elizabethkingia sp. JS20170427COW]
MDYAQIILPLNVKGTYTYKIPEDLTEKVEVGMRVVIPFGGKKLYTGIVAEIHSREPENFLPKEIIALLDQQAILPQGQLNFWQWISQYYLCNIGEIYRFAFPSSMKLESETYVKRNEAVEADYQMLEANEIYLLQALEVKSIINIQELEAFIPRKEIMKTLNSLIDARLILIDEKISEKYKAKEISYLKLKDGLLGTPNLTVVLSSLSRAVKQKALLLKLIDRLTSGENYVRKSEIMEEGTFTSSHLKPLIEKGIVEEFLLQKDRLDTYDGDLEMIEKLSLAQQQALSEIRQVFSEKEVALLHGVTGSGKTHLYIEEIEEYLSKGKNVLMLFPEVGLTKQITQRLEKKYGKVLGFYHSKLTDFEKVEVWKKVKNNELKIILGTRHALFLPFQNLGLVIVDEEHDGQYRSTAVQPYFNAKDSAIMLARFYHAKTILGSATPSVEMYYAALQGKVGLVELLERYGESTLPKVTYINYKEAQGLKTTKGNFTNELVERIQTELDKKKQVIILHNRRGYANVIECETCGYAQYCSNCDVVMTYHKITNELKCHYCGHRSAVLSQCPSCHSDKLTSKGLGIQQLEEEVQRLFPEAKIGRMDLDSMRSKFAYEHFFEQVENRTLDIIIGTQMVSKGLDFDNVDLVVVPKTDAMLHVQDFRAEEKAYQLLTQMSGRAGRTTTSGEMVLQTYNPEQRIFDNLLKKGNKIYEYFISERRKFLYPPFVKLIFIELKHRREDKVERAALFLGAVLRKYLPEECILGPEKAQIFKINNLFQYQVLLKLPKGKKYQFYKSMVLKAKEEFDLVDGYESVKLQVFVDF